LYDKDAAMMERLSPAVIQLTDAAVVVDAELIRETIALARGAPERRARALLHPCVDDSLHEMVIALPNGSCDVPHINYKSGKSFHLIEGEMAVMIFSGDGQSVKAYPLSAAHPSRGRMVRLTVPAWHTIIPLSEYAVFIETIIGPFTGNEFAPWVDKKNTPGWEAFVSEVRAIASLAENVAVEKPLKSTAST
jgi:cupin fold WbuC family metalloprotein